MACFALVSSVAAPAVSASFAGAAAFAAFICATSPAMAQAVVWDANWGIADAPTTIPDGNTLSSVPSGFTFLSKTGSPYFQNGQTIVLLESTAEGAENVTIIGGAGATASGGASSSQSEGPLDAQTWLKVTGGSYNVIAGGSYAENYNGGQQSSFTGDSHILLAAEGGSSPTVNHIIGGNYKDALDAPFNGHSYISVEGGTVNGSIVGAGTSAHLDTAVFNGNSGVWVYTPLSGNNVSLIAMPGNLIVGGNAAINNFSPRLQQEGNSSVTVDLSAYTPVAGAGMDKAIIGDAYLLTNSTSSHTGSSSVSIKGAAADGSNVSFSLPVLAGAYFSGTGTASVSLDTALTVEGGAFSNALVGGSYMASSTATGVSSTLSGNSSVTLGGSLLLSGADARVIGGSYVNAASATVQSGALAVTLNGGSYEGDVIGGSYIAAGSGAVTQTTGDITLAVNNGTVSGTLYGGSYTLRNDAAATNTHGAISLSLEGGSILGNVYAGGGVAMVDGVVVLGSVAATSTQVSVSDAVVLGAAGAPVTISGGVENGESNSITGARTLVLGGSAYANLANAIFTDFNVVNNASAASVNLQAVGASLTKQGVGTLTLAAGSDLASVSTLTLEAGILDAGSTPLTAGGNGLSAITVNAGASLQASALTLADAALLTLDVTSAPATGLIAATGASGLDITGAKTLNLSLSGIAGMAEGTSSTLMSWSNESAPFELTGLTWQNPQEGYVLNIVEQTLVLHRLAANEWVWEGTDGTWSNAADNWQGAGTSTGGPNGKDLTFNTPSSAEATVSISGAVTPASVLVDNAAGTTYTFADGGAGNISGTASLTKENEGTLVVNLANTYSGGTTVNGGTLEAAVAGALGSGAVTLNAGSLVASAQDAVANNALVLNGGSLSYAEGESRNLSTAGISHAAGVVPAVSVAADKEVTWSYDDAAALQNAIGEGLVLSGGGTLTTEATAADVGVELTGPLTLTDAGTTLELASLGAKQLGTAAAPVAVSLAEGTTLRVELPQAAAPSVLYTTLTGAGTLEVANAAGANNTVQLAGNSAAFEGSVNIGSEAAPAAPAAAAPAVILDYSQGSPVGGAAATLNLNGLGFAITRANGTTTETAAAVNLNRNTTQYAQVAGLENTFSGAVTAAAGSTWTLDSTGTAGGQKNILSGNLAGFAGTLEATGAEGSVASWQLGGDGATDNPVLAANLSATNEYNEFVIDYAAASTLSGAVTGQANVTQQGAGTLTLTGDNDSSGTLRIAEGSTVQLGSADDAGQWGNAAAGSTLAGVGTLTLVNGALRGTLAVDGTPQVVVNVASGQSVDMGGNEGSLITGSVTMAEGSTLTNVGSSILDKVLSMTLGVANVGNGAAADTAMVQFVDSAPTLRAVTASLGSTTEAINLDTSASGVVELLAAHRVAGTESFLTLTNGTLVTAADYSNVNFGTNVAIVRDLGLRIDRVEGGSVVLSGEAQGVYIAGEGYDPTTVSGYQNLGAYQAVAVMPEESLLMTLDGAPDPATEGEGAIINNLLGAETSDFIVNNIDPTGEAAVVVLNNSLQAIDPVPEGLPGDPVGANTTFGGDITQAGYDVEFIKTGEGTLTVGGSMEAHQLTVQEGAIALNGAEGNDLDILSLDGGTVQFGAGRSTADTLEDTDNGGSLEIASGATLVSSGTSTLEDAQIGGTAEGVGTLELSGDLSLAEDARLNGVALDLAAGTLGLDGTNGHTVSALNGNGTVEGTGSTETVGLSVTGTGGSFAGTLEGAGTLSIAQGAQQAFASGFAGGAGWNLVNNGNMTLDFAQADGSNAPLSLATLTLAAGSTTSLSFNTAAPTAGMLALDAISVDPAAAVTLASTGSDAIVNADASYIIGTTDGQSAGLLTTLTPDAANVVFMLLDAERSNLSVNENGDIVLNLATSRTNTLASLANNPNSAAGANLLWNAAFSGNTAVGTDIRRVLEALNSGNTGGDANRLLAAAAGSGVAVLSAAFASDLERQLRAIRNRTTTMGATPRVGCKGQRTLELPRVNAWINGEGDHRKLKANGYMPGYTLTSWGGTLGMDVDCNKCVTAGLALTAMYGDLKAHSADNAKGDFDRYYVSAFARMSKKRWQHTLLGTVGRLDADLDRSVYYGAGSYRTHGSTDGWGYGLMYEIGYTIPMDESANFTLQPVANVSWRYADLDSYTENGSDAGLRVRDMDYNVVTFGAGVRSQAEVGQRFMNRRALLEARALVKVDTGDREGEARVAMLGGGGAWDRVRSEKLDAVGVELGAGITIPLGNDRGAFFIDGSAELRNSYSNLNGTVGYRMQF